MRKVTDLEKFALEQIVRPYSTMIDNWQEVDVFGNRHTLTKLPETLDELAARLNEKNLWSYRVLKRLNDCKFYFPPYIQHELVKVCKIGMKDAALQTENEWV